MAGDDEREEERARLTTGREDIGTNDGCVGGIYCVSRVSVSWHNQAQWSHGISSGWFLLLCRTCL